MRELSIFERYHLARSIFGQLRRRPVQALAGENRDTFAAALFGQLDSGINRNQCGLGKMSSFMFGKNQYVTHVE
jgi:hypothetical protein